MAEKIGLEAVMDMASFTKGMKEYTGGIDQMTDKTEKGSGVFGKIGGVLEGIAKVGIGAAIAGFGGLTAIIADSVKEAAAAQEVEAQLEAVLKATGGAAGMTKDEIYNLADALSRVTPFEDDLIASTETVLLQFRNIGEDVFPQATEMALDLATRLGIDAPAAAKLLGKALEEPGEGLARLRQAGVSFTDEQQAMIDKMVAAGDTAGAQKFIMDELEKSIGGAARAAGETYAGKLEILKNTIGNVKETIGNAFLPTLMQLADTFRAFVNENKPQIEAFFKGVAEWTTNTLIPALKQIWDWLATNLPPAIQALGEFWTGTLQPAMAAIWSFVTTSLIPALTEIYNWLATNLPIAIQALSEFWTTTLQPALMTIWAFITESLIPALTEIWNWLATNLPPAIQALAEFWTGTLQPALQTIWDWISVNLIPILTTVAGWFTGEGTSSVTGWVTTIQTFLAPIIQFMSEQFGFIVGWVQQNWPLIQQTIQTVMAAISQVVSTILNAIRQFWQEHGDKIMLIVKTVWDIIKTTIDTVIKTISGIIKAVMQIISGDWSGAWNTIKQTASTLWDGIKKIIIDAITIIKTELQIAWDLIKDIFAKAWQAIQDATGAAMRWLGDIIYKGFEAINRLWQWAIDSVHGIWAGIADWAYGVGKSIVQGIKQGLIDAWDNLVRWVQQQIKELKELIGELFNIGSPSKWAANVGEMITVGLGKGLEKGFQVPVTAVLQGVQDVKAAMSQQLGAGLAVGYNRQSMTPAYATSQNVNVSFGDTTINSGLDAELFQAQVLQTVTRAVRGY